MTGRHKLPRRCRLDSPQAYTDLCPEGVWSSCFPGRPAEPAILWIGRLPIKLELTRTDSVPGSTMAYVLLSSDRASPIRREQRFGGRYSTIARREEDTSSNDWRETRHIQVDTIQHTAVVVLQPELESKMRKAAGIIEGECEQIEE